MLAPIFHALADPTRIAVVERLLMGDATVTELHKDANMALPSFLQHIKMLEKHGVIITEKKGRVRTCKIRAASLKEIDMWLEARRKLWTKRLNQLDNYLSKFKKEDDDE